MHKHRCTYSERLAIWEAYKKECLYCQEPIAFKELHIDHIVPEHLVHHPGEFEALKQELELGDEFLINDFPNWAASHHGCNARKANRTFRRLTYFANGLTAAQVLEELPDLEPENIQACLRFASQRRNHPVGVA
jgi:5-methylcytosine-specific restriction endonuclease McrA